MIHVLRGALYCIVRDIRLLIIVAVLIALSFVPASDAFSRVSTFSEENLDILSSAYGHRSESLEEFKQWFRSEHFVDFSFRKTFENASLTTALCCLALSVYFFGMSAHSRNFNGAIYAGIPRRKQITATLLLYLVVTLIVTSLPTLIVFTFYAPGWWGVLEPGYALRCFGYKLLFDAASAMAFAFIFLLTKSLYKNVGIGILYLAVGFIMALVAASIMYDGTQSGSTAMFSAISNPLYKLVALLVPELLNPSLAPVFLNYDLAPLLEVHASMGVLAGSAVLFAALSGVVYCKRDLT